MAEHILKTWPNVFEAIEDGRKRFEWRQDDRGFEVGDILVLRKWDPVDRHFPNAATWSDFRPYEVRMRVTYILRGLFGVPPGYCVMSIEPEDTKRAALARGLE